MRKRVPTYYIYAHPIQGEWEMGGLLLEGDEPNHPGCMIALFKEDEWGVPAYARAWNEIERRNYSREYMRKKERNV